MNNTLARINDSLYVMGREFGNMLGAAVQSRNFSVLAAPRLRFSSFIDSSKAKLQQMKDVYGSGPLRKSEIDLLEVETHMVNDDFSPFERLTSFATLQQINELFDKIKADSEIESEKMATFKREQRLYAKRNGFELKEERMPQ